MADTVSTDAAPASFAFMIRALAILVFLVSFVACEESTDEERGDSDYFAECDRMQEEARRIFGRESFFGYVENISFRGKVSGDAGPNPWFKFTENLADLGIVDDFDAEIQSIAERWMDLNETAVVIGISGVFDYPDDSSAPPETALSTTESDRSLWAKCSLIISSFGIRFSRADISAPGTASAAQAENMRTSGNALFDSNPYANSGPLFTLRDENQRYSPSIQSFQLDNEWAAPFSVTTLTAAGEARVWSFRDPLLSGQTTEQTSPLANSVRGFASITPLDFVLSMGPRETVHAIDELLQSCWSDRPTEAAFIIDSYGLVESQIGCTEKPIDQPEALGGACGRLLLDNGELDCQLIRDALAPLSSTTRADGTPSELPYSVSLEFQLDVRGASRFAPHSWLDR